VNFENEHRRDVNGLEDDKFHRMNGSDREGSGLFVSVVELVEVFVQKWGVENAMTPIGKVILRNNIISIG
jgi:hypothetical protein